jgi:hypothetical protein
MKSEKQPSPVPALNFPAFTSPQVRRRAKIPWEVVTFQTEPQRLHYMKHFYSPERRLRNKNPARFRMEHQ